MELKHVHNKELWPPPVSGTKVPHPFQPKDQDVTKLGYWNPFRSQESKTQEDLMLMPLHHKWLSFQVLLMPGTQGSQGRLQPDSEVQVLVTAQERIWEPDGKI